MQQDKEEERDVQKQNKSCLNSDSDYFWSELEHQRGR